MVSSHLRAHTHTLANIQLGIHKGAFGVDKWWDLMTIELEKPIVIVDQVLEEEEDLMAIELQEPTVIVDQEGEEEVEAIELDEPTVIVDQVLEDERDLMAAGANCDC